MKSVRVCDGERPRVKRELNPHFPWWEIDRLCLELKKSINSNISMILRDVGV